MRVVNPTPLSAGLNFGRIGEGREVVVAALKATYGISMGKVRLQESMPLLDTDAHLGEPGASPTVAEHDYVPFKPRCDVLVHGRAHAPADRATTSVVVGLAFGSARKQFEVVGDRQWTYNLTGITPTAPAPFRTMSIAYDRAFGGTIIDDSGAVRTYQHNPVGRGYHPSPSPGIAGYPVPNTQEIRDAIRHPGGTYRPMSFGCVGRSWLPRYPLAGTYNHVWLDDVFPLLPDDFDPSYHQAAPPDQQVPHPRGGERVALLNLSPEATLAFEFPRLDIRVTFVRGGERVTQPAVVDTVLLEPDESRMQVTLRTSLPLIRDIFEIKHVEIDGSIQGEDP